MSYRTRSAIIGLIFLIGYWLVWWMMQLVERYELTPVHGPKYYGADAIEYGRHETVAYKGSGRNGDMW